jgi:hypothetical protein
MPPGWAGEEEINPAHNDWIKKWEMIGAAMASLDVDVVVFLR